MKKTARVSLAALLKAIQERRGLTQREAANLAGISLGYWNHLLSGKRKRISTEVFDKIQKAFNIDRETLMRAVRNQLTEMPQIEGIPFGSTHINKRTYTRAQKKTIERIKRIIETGSEEDIADLDRLTVRILESLSIGRK